MHIDSGTDIVKANWFWLAKFKKKPTSVTGFQQWIGNCIDYSCKYSNVHTFISAKLDGYKNRSKELRVY